MDYWGKIVLGAGATSLLAVFGHFAAGEKFVAGLEDQARSELTARGLEGADVSFGRDPLSRSAVLDGDLAGEAKEEALTAVLSVPGVSNARWQGDKTVANKGSEPAKDETTERATATKVNECQSGINTIIEEKKITFRSGSAYVSPDANRILDEVAQALKPCDGLTITVEGHTDDNGDAEVNKILSQERADRIKTGLVDRELPETLVSATGYGSERPRIEGSDAAADAQNRRIEFRIGSTGPASKAEGE